ncbi:MAG: glycyl-radical enzyme activating protein [Bacteroidales bacterium]|jgi:pyruvate formate lyase activating enzyme|nr:glycyl-radical enzyme activating protein [Bacteroidales bacterium]
MKQCEEGLVFDIHRGTTHDGPGLRTTVFLKGCPLRCEWCHNPEGISPQPEIQWTSRLCIACKTCVASCPEQAVVFDETGVHIAGDCCTMSLQCVANCPSGALKVAGKRWQPEALVREVRKDAMFFDEFEGGVTVSGGEPLWQYRFVAEFFRLLKQAGENTALDTSGFASREAFEAVYPFTDVFLYDLKFICGKQHKQHTGVDNGRIKDNFRWLAGKCGNDESKRLWVRTPLIPDATATVENIAQIGRFTSQDFALDEAVTGNNAVERWELCSFNNISRDKYARMRREWKYASVPLMTQAEIGKLLAEARKYLGEKVFATGLSAKEVKNQFN